MLKLLHISTFSAFLVAGSVSAQSFPIPPKAVPNNGGENVVPFGAKPLAKQWINQRYQCLVKAKHLGSAASLNISDLGFAPFGTGTRVQHFDSIEIVMGQTNATTLGSTFATNLAANVKTVLKATNYDWHVTPDKWNRIGLDTTYSYIPAAFGANLVIQITVKGAHSSTGNGFRTQFLMQRVIATNWTGTPPTTGTHSPYLALILEVVVGMNDMATFGLGCPGAGTSTPTLAFQGSAKLGQSFSIDLSNAPSSSPMFHVIGFSRYEPAVDLSFLGSPGCILYPKVDLLLANVTSPTGTYIGKFVIPNDKMLVGQRFYTQYAVLTKGKFAVTNYGRILVGN